MRRVLLFVLVAVLSLPALNAAELAGVTMPPTTTVSGKQLTLNGMGLRTKFFFKVYVAALYLERVDHDAAGVISSDQMKRIDMVMLRDLDRGKIIEAVEEGFRKNNESRMPALRERLDRFNKGIVDLEKGDHLTITYIPGQGTRLEGKGSEPLVIEGKDFAEALFSVWFGTHPVDGDLKNGMLGS